MWFRMRAIKRKSCAAPSGNKRAESRPINRHVKPAQSRRRIRFQRPASRASRRYPLIHAAPGHPSRRSAPRGHLLSPPALPPRLLPLSQGSFFPLPAPPFPYRCLRPRTTSSLPTSATPYSPPCPAATLPGRHLARPPPCPAASLPGRLLARPPPCPAASLPCRLARPPPCPAASLPCAAPFYRRSTSPPGVMPLPPLATSHSRALPASFLLLPLLSPPVPPLPCSIANLATPLRRASTSRPYLAPLPRAAHQRHAVFAALPGCLLYLRHPFPAPLARRPGSLPHPASCPTRLPAPPGFLPYPPTLASPPGRHWRRLRGLARLRNLA
jgi:hypothetical protein